MTAVPATRPPAPDAEAWKYYARVLARRGDSSFAAERTALASGMYDVTKDASIPFVQSVASDKWGQRERDGFRFALALTALHLDTPNAPAVKRDDGTKRHASFGGTLADLTLRMTGSLPQAAPDQRDNIARKVALLADCDLEEAAFIISSMLSTAGSSKHFTPIGFTDMARTLTYWGNGFADRSVETRRRIITDYYTRRAK